MLAAEPTRMRFVAAIRGVSVTSILSLHKNINIKQMLQDNDNHAICQFLVLLVTMLHLANKDSVP